MYREHESDLPTATGTIPLGDRLVPSADKDVPGIAPTPLPPVPAPGSGGLSGFPRRRRAPCRHRSRIRRRPRPHFRFRLRHRRRARRERSGRRMPDLLRSLLPKLDRAPAIELPAGAMSAATKGTEATTPPPLTPEQSQQRVAEAEAVLRQARTAEINPRNRDRHRDDGPRRSARHPHPPRRRGGAAQHHCRRQSGAIVLAATRSTRPTLADTMPSASAPTGARRRPTCGWTRRR